MKQIFLSLTIFLLLTLTNRTEDYIGWGTTDVKEIPLNDL